MRMETSDENLVTLAQAGDAAAFSALVSRHYDLIHRIGYRILGSQAEAQDMAQDLCLSLAGKIKNFRSDSKLKTGAIMKQTPALPMPKTAPNSTG